MIAENTSLVYFPSGYRFFFSCFHSVGYDLWQGLTAEPLPVSLLCWKPGGNVAVWNPFWQVWKEKGVFSGIFYHELVKSWLCSGPWILHLYLSTCDHLNRVSWAGGFLCVVHGGHRVLLSQLCWNGVPCILLPGLPSPGSDGILHSELADPLCCYYTQRCCGGAHVEVGMIMPRHSMTMSFSTELFTVWIYNGLWVVLLVWLSVLNDQHFATVMRYTNSFNLRGSSISTIVEHIALAPASHMDHGKCSNFVLHNHASS